MKKKITSFIALVFMAAVLFCSSAAAFDANNYDYDFDYDDDWSSFDTDIGDTLLGGLSCLSVFFPSPIIIIVIVILLANKNKNKQSGTAVPMQPNQAAGNVMLPNRNNDIQNIIKRKDPNFSADDFVTYAKQVYIDIQTAWCSRDMTSVRPIMQDNLFANSQKMAEENKAKGIVYHYESIAINTAYLTSYVRDSGKEYLTVYLNARMFNYITDEKTGNIISGNKTSREDLRYKMRFIRKAGTETKSAVKSAQGYNCPNCGAPLEVTSSGECPYCGSIVNIGDYSWILNDFSIIRGNVTDEGIRVPPEDMR